MLSSDEQMELQHCLQVNAKLVMEMDGLKQLCFMAHEIGDYGWEQELCGKIEALEQMM